MVPAYKTSFQYNILFLLLLFAHLQLEPTIGNTSAYTAIECLFIIDNARYTYSNIAHSPTHYAANNINLLLSLLYFIQNLANAGWKKAKINARKTDTLHGRGRFIYIYCYMESNLCICRTRVRNCRNHNVLEFINENANVKIYIVTYMEMCRILLVCSGNFFIYLFIGIIMVPKWMYNVWRTCARICNG